MKIKNVEKVAKATKGINYRTRIKLYFDFDTSEVLTEEMARKRKSDSVEWLRTELIRECTPEEVRQTVIRMLSM